MCGINGIIFKSSTNENAIKQQLTKMNDLILHRGPDDDGLYIDTAGSISVSMAMRRLSIIDLSTGKQPMSTNDNKIGIVFNGEIYNYRFLKQQLESSGITFKTTSDTEVILKLYEQKGVAAFKELDGMFAFSIHDKIKNKVFIARDFFGEKPLYYTHTENQFLWASELKSIMVSLPTVPEISKEGLNLFFRLTYIPAPYTIYKTIHKLEPNSYISYDLNNFEFNIHSIHDTKPKEKSNLSFEAAKKEVKERVKKSVESRSISDVPLGTFLSGGVDSSVVSLCLSQMNSAKIDTFSIGFEKEAFDETDKSRLVAKLINSNHHEFIISESDLKDNIDDILINFDEPFADSSSLPTYLVSNKTKQYVKVALTGDGGDEVFGGYNKYYIGKLNNHYTKLFSEDIHQKINKSASKILNSKDDNRGFKYKIYRLLNAIDYTDNYYWDIISLGFETRDIHGLLTPDFQQVGIFDYFKKKSGISNPKTLNDFMTIDRHLSLEGDMLVKVDRASMLNSLECRAPFLNRELFEFAMSLPENFLLNKWKKKHILKEAFKDQFPAGFLEKSKQGFGVPVGDWLRQGLKKELLGYSEVDFLNRQGIFNTPAILELVQHHIAGKSDNSFKVWTFFCFQKWYTKTFKS
ncbi:MAG: asparagine synthase (glutamine-hydrolyzing) [Aquaticitalea sp.]